MNLLFYAIRTPNLKKIRHSQHLSHWLHANQPKPCSGPKVFFWLLRTFFKLTQAEQANDPIAWSEIEDLFSMATKKIVRLS